MHSFKYALTILFFCLASSVHAAQTNYGQITKIKAFNSQAYIYVSDMGDNFDCASGGTTPGALARFYWTTTQADKLWSMLLAAQMSGKEVSFEGSCVSGLLSIETVYIKN